MSIDVHIERESNRQQKEQGLKIHIQYDIPIYTVALLHHQKSPKNLYTFIIYVFTLYKYIDQLKNLSTK